MVFKVYVWEELKCASTGYYPGSAVVVATSVNEAIKTVIALMLDKKVYFPVGCSTTCKACKVAAEELRSAKKEILQELKSKPPRVLPLNKAEAVVFYSSE